MKFFSFSGIDGIGSIEHALSVVHVQVCFKSFYLLCFFLAGQGSGQFIKFICAFGWFVRMENNNCTSNTQKTFEADVHSSSAPKLHVLIEKECTIYF